MIRITDLLWAGMWLLIGILSCHFGVLILWLWCSIIWFISRFLFSGGRPIALLLVWSVGIILDLLGGDKLGPGGCFLLFQNLIGTRLLKNKKIYHDLWLIVSTVAWLLYLYSRRQF